MSAMPPISCPLHPAFSYDDCPMEHKYGSRAPTSAPAREASEDAETERYRQIALTVNDAALNRDKVSVNQVRHILKVAAASLEHEIGEARKERDAWAEYGEHKPGCAHWDADNVACTCGFASLRGALRASVATGGES